MTLSEKSVQSQQSMQKAALNEPTNLIFIVRWSDAAGLVHKEDHICSTSKKIKFIVN